MATSKATDEKAASETARTPRSNSAAKSPKTEAGIERFGSTASKETVPKAASAKRRVKATGAGVRGRKTSSIARAIPFPAVSIPSIPTTGKYCLWGINKTFDGPISGQLGTPYRCETGSTSHSPTQITFRVSSSGGPNCDQAVPGLPPSFQLQAKGATVHRQDGFAHFMGSFIFKNMATNTTLFKGTMELIGRIGSHQHLGEKCDEDMHIEGWLVGLGVGNLARYTVRAVVIAQLHANLPTGTALDTSRARITGAIVKAP